MSTLSFAFRLPLPTWPRARLESDYRFLESRLSIAGEEVARFDELALRQGATVDWNGHALEIRLDDHEVELRTDGVRALREDRLSAPTCRSAWIHAFVALFASFAGFMASWLYLRRAGDGDPWALKMAIHMAGWHALLTLTLFPASVWGQRLGIRAVQLASAVFFCIHAGIALANAAEVFDGIALFNALSGLLFLVAVLYGQRAHRDMDPIRALLSHSGRLVQGAAFGTHPARSSGS